MARQRSPIPMHPSRAQGLFFLRFEELYFAMEGRTLDTLELGEPPTEERKKPDGWAAGIPRRTYMDWRKQISSPTIRDLEKLCALTAQRQTLLIDPSQLQNERDGNMGWYDRANELVGRLASMEPEARGAVLARLEDAIEKEFAREGARNPLEPAEAIGSRHGRRK